MSPRQGREPLPYLSFVGMHLSLLALLAGGSQAAYSTSIAAAAASVDAAATAYISSSDRKYNVSTWEAPVSGAGTPGDSSTWSLSVDDTASGHKQVVTGFGAAVTDATVAVINALPADLRTELLSALMTSAGADFSLLRHTVGASDLSADPAYTYDDAGGQADASLSDFSLGDRGTAMAELLAEMQTLNSNAKLLGSVWAPPAWMQLDRNLTGSTVNVSSHSLSALTHSLACNSSLLPRHMLTHEAEQLGPLLRRLLCAVLCQVYPGVRRQGRTRRRHHHSE